LFKHQFLFKSYYICAKTDKITRSNRLDYGTLNAVVVVGEVHTIIYTRKNLHPKRGSIKMPCSVCRYAEFSLTVVGASTRILYLKMGDY